MIHSLWLDFLDVKGGLDSGAKERKEYATALFSVGEFFRFGVVVVGEVVK